MDISSAAAATQLHSLPSHLIAAVDAEDRVAANAERCRRGEDA
jgi:hypothetical protein